jgi:hypothetical protein
MEERRAVQRTKVLRNAKIILDHRASVISCTVNLSGQGACLSVAGTYLLPETFELTFEHGRSRRQCRVIWRTSDKMGVAFEPPPGPAL